VWFERFGFVTLPYMALSGFALIGTLLLTIGLRSPAPEPTHHRADPAAPVGRSSASATTSNPTSTSSSVPSPVSGPAAFPGRAADATLLQENRS
jgi:hypothetical protein